LVLLYDFVSVIFINVRFNRVSTIYSLQKVGLICVFEPQSCSFAKVEFLYVLLSFCVVVWLKQTVVDFNCWLELSLNTMLLFLWLINLQEEITLVV